MLTQRVITRQGGLIAAALICAAFGCKAFAAFAATSAFPESEFTSDIASADNPFFEINNESREHQTNSAAGCEGEWLPGFAAPGMDNTVYAITTWDPDGNGPQPAQLVAGGNFTTAGGVTVNRIARWDGSAWLPFGTGMSGGSFPQVRALTTWDPDGVGPQSAQLVAGGAFSTASGLTVNGIARWNGSAWQPFGTGMSGGSVPEVRA